MTGYYSVFKIESMQQLKELFPTGEANEYNWCLLSTSGVHGTYATLDATENGEYDDDEYPLTITVLVIKPRIVQTLYGNIEITKDDIPYLRKLVNSSLTHIQRSQTGNL